MWEVSVCIERWATILLHPFLEVSFLKIACSVLSYQSIKFLNILIVFQIIEMPIDIIFFLEIQIYILNFFINIKKKQLNCVDCVKFFRTHHIDTTFVEFYGIISAIPRHWRHLINTCHNLIYKENRFIHVTDWPKNHVNISIDSLLIKTHLYL